MAVPINPNNEALSDTKTPKAAQAFNRESPFGQAFRKMFSTHLLFVSLYMGTVSRNLHATHNKTHECSKCGFMTIT